MTVLSWPQTSGLADGVPRLAQAPVVVADRGPAMPANQAGGATATNTGTAAWRALGWQPATVDRGPGVLVLPPGDYADIRWERQVALRTAGLYRFLRCEFAGGPAPAYGSTQTGLQLLRCWDLGSRSRVEMTWCDVWPMNPSALWNGIKGSQLNLDACRIGGGLVDGIELFSLADPDGPSGTTLLRGYSGPVHYESAARDPNGKGPQGQDWPNSLDTHNDSFVQWEGGTGGLIRWCTVDAYRSADSVDRLGYRTRVSADNPGSTRGTGQQVQDGIFIKPDVGRIADVTVRDNLVRGGRICINVADRTAAPARAVTGIVVQDNVLDGWQDTAISATETKGCTGSGNTTPSGAPAKTWGLA